VMNWNDHMAAGGWIFSVLILAILVAIVVWIVSGLGDRRGRGTSSSASAGEILDRRLASGEITVEQYEQLRQALDQGSPPLPDRGPGHPAGVRG
jgi:uncharacterized membrane protein